MKLFRNRCICLKRDTVYFESAWKNLTYQGIRDHQGILLEIGGMPDHIQLLQRHGISFEEKYLFDDEHFG